MLRRLGKIALPFIAILTCSTALAQDTDNSEETKANTIDEVIVEGIKNWEGHDGMDAFTSGDFVKAEIEFEQEFKSLRRAESAKYNAGVDASLGFDRAEAVGQSGLGGLSASGPGSSVPLTTNGGTPDLGVTGRFSNKYKKGKNLLNDGKVTEEDFAFTKYMAGLSELQLGKYEEAKKSFKRSVGYNGRNYDARMRLGLLYVVERDFDKAANQLEALEKMRLKCKKKDCDDYDAILKSAATLAQGISGNLKTQ